MGFLPSRLARWFGRYLMIRYIPKGNAVNRNNKANTKGVMLLITSQKEAKNLKAFGFANGRYWPQGTHCQRNGIKKLVAGTCGQNAQEKKEVTQALRPRHSATRNPYREPVLLVQYRAYLDRCEMDCSSTIPTAPTPFQLRNAPTLVGRQINLLSFGLLAPRAAFDACLITSFQLIWLYQWF